MINSKVADLNHELAVEAFRNLVLFKKRPDWNEYEVFKNFRKNGLIQTADYLHFLI